MDSTNIVVIMLQTKWKTSQELKKYVQHVLISLGSAIPLPFCVIPPPVDMCRLHGYMYYQHQDSVQSTLVRSDYNVVPE